MRSFTKLLILGALILVLAPVYGQQVPLFNQYYEQPSITYPSASVLKNAPQLSLLYRGQLSGLEGAPVTFGLSYANPLSNKLGYHINLNNHELGVLRQTAISAGLSKMILTKEHKLSFGLEAGLSLFSIDESRVSVESLTDELIQNILGNNGSAGFLSASVSYSNKALTAHITAPNLIHGSLSDGDFDELSRANRPDFSGSVSYTIDIDPINNIRFSPQITWRKYRVIGGALDVTGKFEFKDKLQVTAGYREGFGSTAGLGVQVKPGLLFTYQYDFGNSDVPFLSDGFNELGLHLSFKSRREAEVENFDAGQAVLDRLHKEEIYDKKLISQVDQSAAIGYLGSLEEGSRKVKEKKGEEAFDRVLEDIESKGRARLQAEADQRRVDAERQAREKAEEQLAENRLAEERVAQEKAILEKEAARLQAESDKATKEEISPQKALDGDYIVVVGAFLPGSPNAKNYFESLKAEFPEGGIYENKVRGFEYVYAMHFSEKSKAIEAMQKLRKDTRFSDSWVHILSLNK